MKCYLYNDYRFLQDIRDDVFASNPEYEQLRELGRQIMHADPLRAAQVQAQLAQVKSIYCLWHRMNIQCL